MPQHTKTSGEEQQACLSWEWVLRPQIPLLLLFLLLTNSIIIIIFVDFKQQQDRQCTYNATMWRVRATTVVVGKQ